MSDGDLHCKYLIIGGGIAGVSCVEELLKNDTSARIILVSSSTVVKRTFNVKKLSKIITQFDVMEQNCENFASESENLEVLTNEFVEFIDSSGHFALTKSGKKIVYEKTCVCSGASPTNSLKDLCDFDTSEKILTLRDTESLSYFLDKLAKVRTIAIVGNGGIATDLVYNLKNVSIKWIVKDDFPISAFLDKLTAQFFIERMNKKSKDLSFSKLTRIERSQNGSSFSFGPSLGPSWHDQIILQGQLESEKNLKIYYQSSVKKLSLLNSSEIFVELSDGSELNVDVIVCATGVNPNGDKINGLQNCVSSGAIIVDESMKTCLPDVFAAGDVIKPVWPNASEDWFQMRLWTQAKQMGAFAGIRMSSNENEYHHLDFCFEMFSHVTRFFGYKIILLGLYNGQGLKDYELAVRTDENEFVKVVKSDGIVRGAILIGDTDLEETFENLILSRIKVDELDLLHPEIDIESYFD